MIAAFFGSLRNYVPQADFQLETASTRTAPQVGAVSVVYVCHCQRVFPDVRLQRLKACCAAR